MIQLANVFQDGMLLQRNKPCRVWGTSDEKQTVEVCVDERRVAEWELPAGAFSCHIPPQEEAFGVTVRIGDVELANVDFGEVWVAGGQSNMEFYMKYDAEFEAELEKVKKAGTDTHLRYYEVAKYCFEGEEKDGFKDDSNWNRWRCLSEGSMGDFSAVALYFALEMRKKYGVPVGIVSCNWGGTSASAWIGREMLSEDGELAVYLREYEENVARMDLEAYERKNDAMRQSMSTPFARASSDYMMKNTVTVEEVVQYSMKLAAEAGIDVEKMMAQGQAASEEATSVTTESGLATSEEAASAMTESGLAESAGNGQAVSVADFSMVGPRDANRPCGLYETMLSKVAGFTARGVLWYQGESDVGHCEIYGKLFAKLVEQLRKDWAENIPVIYVQVAPFESWMQARGDKFPEIRKQQFAAWKAVENVHMVSSSDCGNRYDIHPKNKRPIGHRMALCAFKNVYGEDVQGDAPVAVSVKRAHDASIADFEDKSGMLAVDFAKKKENELVIVFENAKMLHVDGEDVQRLEVYVGGEPCRILEWSVAGNELRVSLERKEDGEAEKSLPPETLAGHGLDGQTVEVRFAQTPYYQVNLYNESGLPVFPFVLEI
jgi:sialate O-acetylesterase